MGFQDVAFLPSRCVAIGEGLWSTECLKTVVGVSKGMLSVGYFCCNKASFYVNLILWLS